jgi:hypothetical protein
MSAHRIVPRRSAQRAPRAPLTLHAFGAAEGVDMRRGLANRQRENRAEVIEVDLTQWKRDAASVNVIKEELELLAKAADRVKDVEKAKQYRNARSKCLSGLSFSLHFQYFGIGSIGVHNLFAFCIHSEVDRRVRLVLHQSVRDECRHRPTALFSGAYLRRLQ